MNYKNQMPGSEQVASGCANIESLVSSIMDNVEVHAAEMRGKQDPKPLAIELKDEIYTYFRKTKETRGQLNVGAAGAAAWLYNNASVLEAGDDYTSSYFRTVVSYLFESFQTSGTDIFYIAVHRLPDEMVESLTRLFELCGFAVVAHYKYDRYLTYEEIKTAIIHRFSESRNLVYLEKDSVVSHREKVLILAGKSKKISPDSNYVSIFTNEAPGKSDPTILGGDEDEDEDESQS